MRSGSTCCAARATAAGCFYRERRISRGRAFDLLKLRTLRESVLGEAEGHVRPFEADAANLTWAGRRVLKPLYLDELPQLVNVLRGEMSLVGPRPWPPELVERQLARGVDYRLRVTAGWTGPAQVSKGLDVQFENLDRAYVELLETRPARAVVRHDLGILAAYAGDDAARRGARVLTYEMRIEIRWRDVDALRHVNNAVYATYLEECRDGWLERALGDDGAHVGLRPRTRRDRLPERGGARRGGRCSPARRSSGSARRA